VKLTGQATYPDTEAGYRDAEDHANAWAGDNDGYAVVIANTENNLIHVMDHGDAEGFLAEWEGMIIYHADHRGWCRTCENLITGQRIRSRDHDYCSFTCLAGAGGSEYDIR